MSFEALGVDAELVSILSARGIGEPMPIQALTLPDASRGRDVCGRAPTGSGKTLAFGIPLVSRVGRATRRRPTGLVLVPTRELAAQVCRELEWLGQPRDVRVAALYGGVGFGAQLKALRRGVEVVVACPGRLEDLIARGEVDLSGLEVVVVDEADRMADMGFLPAVRRLLDTAPSSRQTMLFSATLDGTVEALVQRYQRDPVRHMVAETSEEHTLAEHVFWKVEAHERVQLCADVIKLAGPTIVFCRTKHGADRLARQLEKTSARSGVIHGNRSQSQRERALQAFADGDVDALVATDVAARGIHVDGVACVLHFDPPADGKTYTHRSGRTARAGALGKVVSFVGPEQTRGIEQLQRELGLRVGLIRPQRGDLSSLTDHRRDGERRAAKHHHASDEDRSRRRQTVIDGNAAGPTAGRTRRPRRAASNRTGGGRAWRR